MATRVVMEALSPTMEEGRLVAWKKKEGEAVKAGETLAEVETDKAVMELVARGDGVLRTIVIQEGATVPVSALVAIIGSVDEDISGLAGEAGNRQSAIGNRGPARRSREWRVRVRGRPAQQPPDCRLPIADSRPLQRAPKYPRQPFQ